MRYHLTLLEPVKGYRETLANAINERGQIVGEMSADNTECAVIWNEGKPTKLEDTHASGDDRIAGEAIDSKGEVVGGNCCWRQGRFSYFIAGKAFAKKTGSERLCQLNAINENGVIVGYGYSVEHEQSAIVWRNGKPFLLEEPGFYGSEALAINRAGQIVGYAKGGWSGTRAVLWESGKRIWLGSLPNRESSVANALNDAGKIVGHAYRAAERIRRGQRNRQAFVWESGRMRELPALVRGAESSARGINNSGLIVGWSHIEKKEPDELGDPESGARAVIWEQGEARDLNKLLTTKSPWILWRALGVNSRGQIVGYAQDAKEARRAFCLTPVGT